MSSDSPARPAHDHPSGPTATPQQPASPDGAPAAVPPGQDSSDPRTAAVVTGAHRSLAPGAPHSRAPRGRLGPLALGALGVVYGDIGTSPLYALNECFHGEHGL